MTQTASAEPSRRAPEYLVEERSLGAECVRYGAAAALVLAAFLAAAVATQLADHDAAAPSVDDAILIDLPPVAAAPEPKSDADEGPEQRAAAASAAVPTPPPEPPKPVVEPAEPVVEPAKPVVEPKPPEEPQPPAPPAPPPPPAPDPAAVLEHTQPPPTPAPPPPPVAAPAAAPQEEMAPQGSDMPTKDQPAEGDEGQPHASPRAMTSWQKAMMSRLEGAKRSLPRHLGYSGTVKVAFAIDADGRLTVESVRQSSGVDALDRAALQLIKQAAPFPAPPPGAGAAALSFTVPIRFRH